MLSTGYMFIAVKYVVDESIDDGGLADCLIPKKDYLVLQQWRNRAFRHIEVADVRRHF